ncbi:hypothetical protein ACFV29_39585 [Streptomyces sp. NPDC059690]|uniref:hypothetical protein n=1 Tax=Streptomyces sp. NPDC059690 TaxID=3346907 RepID=UPI00369247DC
MMSTSARTSPRSGPGEDDAGLAIEAAILSPDVVFQGLVARSDPLCEHAQLGEVFWAALPLPHNTSKDPLAIKKARFTEIPKGLKIGEYRIFNANEVGGIYLLAYDGGKYGMKDPEKFTNYAGKPARLKAKQESDYYYAAKATVTGPVHKNPGGCSFCTGRTARSTTKR